MDKTKVAFWALSLKQEIMLKNSLPTKDTKSLQQSQVGDELYEEAMRRKRVRRYF